VICACTCAPRKRGRRGSARNFFPLQGQLCKMGLRASRTATTGRALVPRRRAAAVLVGAPRCGADTQLRPERGTSSRTGAATRSTDAVRRGATEAVNARGTNTIGVHDRTASSQTFTPLSANASIENVASKCGSEQQPCGPDIVRPASYPRSVYVLDNVGSATCRTSIRIRQ